jgi:phospholipid/cholesterol/gamma-HCH transport system substrate-binding protein
MENNARYMLVGCFALAVLAAAFGFVYWLNTGGGLQQRASYRVLYKNSVAGLMIGSPVLFNGVRVGEVTALDLDASAPTQITATIALAARTPVRADTKAGISFQGLMGSPAVSLSGGSPSATAFPPLLSEALLVADPNAGQSMSETAITLIRRVDAVVSDNSDALHKTMSNLGKFTDALARNSDRVDGILAGLDRMTGGSSKSALPTYQLTAVDKFPEFKKADVGLLVVQYPTAAAVLGQDKIMVRDGGTLKPVAADAKWSDMLLDQFQGKLVQSFENASYLGQVSRPVEGVTPDYQLLVDIRDFDIVAGAEPEAKVEFAARIVSNDGKIIGAKLFSAKAPARTDDAALAASGLDQAFRTASTDLVLWASATMANAPSAAR